MPLLRAGDGGDDVRRLQRLLKEKGYETYEDSGLYGEGTWQAIARFQQQHGLPADGVADERTWRALMDAPMDMMMDTMGMAGNTMDSTMDGMEKCPLCGRPMPYTGADKMDMNSKMPGEMGNPMPPQTMMPEKTSPMSMPGGMYEDYMVKPGDTLPSLAGRFGVPMQDLQRASNLPDDRLAPGQMLKIPMK